MLINTRSDFFVGVRWSVCISKLPRILFSKWTRTDSGLCRHHLLGRPNFNLLHNSQWITFPIQSYLFMLFFCASLQHSLLIWLTISSMSPHNLHLLFFCVLSTFALLLSLFLLTSAVPDISTLTQEQYTIAIYVMGGMHNFFSLLVLISYFVCNHPSLPNPKSIIVFLK